MPEDIRQPELDAVFADASPETPDTGEATTTAAPVVDSTPTPTPVDERYTAVEKAYADSRLELYELKRQLSDLKATQAPKAEVADKEEDIAQALADLVKLGPNKAFQAYLEKNLSKFLDPVIAPYKQSLAQIQKEKEIDSFLTEHDDVTPDVEAKLVQVIQKTPWIKNMSGSVYDKLDAAYSKLLSSGGHSRPQPPPSTQSPQVTISPSDAGRALAAAKTAAGAIGAKGGKVSTVPKDEFDEVLEDYAAQKALWK